LPSRSLKRMTNASTLEKADDLVRASVRALMAGARHNNVSLAAAVGMSSETLRQKLRATGEVRAFTAGEIARIAAFFGTPVEELFNGLGGRVQLPSEASGTLSRAPGARSSTDRASDYGSEGAALAGVTWLDGWKPRRASDLPQHQVLTAA
jgi:DNA-binding Xre family transcriptional regulator